MTENIFTNTAIRSEIFLSNKCMNKTNMSSTVDKRFQYWSIKMVTQKFKRKIINNWQI